MSYSILGITVDTDIRENLAHYDLAVEAIKEHLPTILNKLDDIDRSGYLSATSSPENEAEDLINLLTTALNWVIFDSGDNTWEIPNSDRTFIAGATDTGDIDYSFPVYDEVLMLTHAVEEIPELANEIGIYGEGIIL